MAKGLLAANEALERLKSQVAIMQPKADALDRIGGLAGSITVTEAAKALQVAPKELTTWLMNHRWAYRRTPRSELLGRQEKLNAGHLEHKVYEVPRGWRQDVTR